MTEHVRSLILRALDAYHDEPAYYRAIEAVRGQDAPRAAKTILDFLKGWGEMARLPKSGTLKRARWEASLARWLREHRKDLDELDPERIWSTDFSEAGPAVVDLFDSLRGLQKGFGPNAAGKTLHVLLPGLCVIWDLIYVRDAQDFGEDGHAYLDYLKTRKTILCDLVEEVKRETGATNHEAVVNWLVEQHGRRWSGCKPPVTKLLDELNYDDRPELVDYLKGAKRRSMS